MNYKRGGESNAAKSVKYNESFYHLIFVRVEMFISIEFVVVGRVDIE